MSKLRAVITAACAVALPGWCGAAPSQLTVKATNKLAFARPSQTIELSAKHLAPLGEKELDKIHVQDAAGKELLCQAVDTDGDYTPDVVIFQARFAPGESKTFTVTTGKKQVYTKDQFKAYGRFVRERFDDFAWENDRIAHRTYGTALETWQREPLTSSAIDVWVKSVSHLVINNWYMVDNYHTDAGEGADFYSAGNTRGDGGDGLWADNKLWVSKNFANSRVLANGPIRVMFELTYEPFDVNGAKVAEVRRVTLDAGQNLDHYQCYYKPEQPVALVAAVGIKKSDVAQTDLNSNGVWFTTWELLRDNKRAQGHLGQAIIVNPKQFEKTTEDKLNYLVIATVPNDNCASYWAGFGWDKSGQFSDYAAWKTYVEQFSRELASPIEISVSAD